MILVKNIQIERFRSCRRTKISEASSFSILCGKNNSGKSNILRGLSLFFLNEIEPGVPLNLSSDCSAAPKEKKVISISVVFDIPHEIKIQGTIKDLEKRIPRNATIRKEYLLAQSSPLGYEIDYFVNDNKLPPNEKKDVEQFLNLFNFRYITADRTPKAVLEQNLDELKAELKFRLNRRGGRKALDKDNISEQIKNALKDINKLADTVFLPVKDEIKRADQNIADVSISIPDDVTELLNASTYLLKTSNGNVFSERVQGHGIQNLLLFAVLYLIDKNFHRKFGWKIATIWAVEEPETFMHCDLENQLARYFCEISEKPGERFQLFVSTHSDVFPQYASSHYYISLLLTDKVSIGTRSEKYELHEYLNKLYETKITNVPILLTTYPNKQIILTEGDIDECVIRIYLKMKGFTDTVAYSINKYITDGTNHGGETKLLGYLKANHYLMPNRIEGRGIVAVFDWDTEETKISKLRKHIHTPNHIYHFKESMANPLLDKSFRGIERFYDLGPIEELAKRNEGLIIDRGEKITKDRFYVDAARYGLVKNELCKIIKARGMSFTYFLNFEQELRRLGGFLV